MSIESLSLVSSLKFPTLHLLVLPSEQLAKIVLEASCQDIFSIITGDDIELEKALLFTLKFVAVYEIDMICLLVVMKRDCFTKGSLGKPLRNRLGLESVTVFCEEESRVYTLN